ncbi:hypothetical protein A3G67_00390 [Candidatus Roizmanbacteria bacterium RIFCSPLOWO2_12_FULL_40_12]|nr:MAG: hypothetical protein A2W49_04465 [Candidatus Roizmanbacteria bacterium RIFCSPHIGHO2_12_41_18]OGK58923.1 MAG: hypothetical protein A3H84_04335 [Candidatus Roizmanbacteria bacterium RIFCSPLOWO2_02_FULL_40_13]OGK61233.1 MAG: hypothetical protein A3G67_00390 [Candidatus Roizmanbacteria bacterium RIFCSPLOWO2_12_FULL_40_12]
MARATIEQTAKRYGRTAVLTPSNGLSLARIVGGPTIAALTLSAERPSWSLFGLHMAFWATDWADGFLARRQGTTKFGEELDKASDKVYTYSEFIALIAKGTVSWVPVALMGLRDVFLEKYRNGLRKEDISTAAKWHGKIKTNVQLGAIAFALSPALENAPTTVKAGVWTAAATTLVSGASYGIGGRKERRAKRKAEKQVAINVPSVTVSETL